MRLFDSFRNKKRTSPNTEKGSHEEEVKKRMEIIESARRKSAEEYRKQNEYTGKTSTEEAIYKSGEIFAEIEGAIAAINNLPGAKRANEVAAKEARALMEELERRKNETERAETVAREAEEFRKKLGIISNETMDTQQDKSENAWDSFINSLKKKAEMQEATFENPVATRKMQKILENPVAIRELKDIYEKIGTISQENCRFSAGLEIEFKDPGNVLKKEKSYSIEILKDGIVAVREFMLEDTGGYLEDTNIPLYRRRNIHRKIDANGVDMELFLYDEIFEAHASKERSKIYEIMCGSKGTSISRSYKRSQKSIDDVTYEKEVIHTEGTGTILQVLEHTVEQMTIPGKRITIPQEIAHEFAKDTTVALHREDSTTLLGKLAKEVSRDEKDNAKVEEI